MGPAVLTGGRPRGGLTRRPEISTPGHYSDCTVIGDIAGFLHTDGGLITGLVVEVTTGDAPSRLPVLLNTPVAGFRKGARVWMRGEVKAGKLPGVAQPVIYLVPRHLEVLKPRATPARPEGK